MLMFKEWYDFIPLDNMAKYNPNWTIKKQAFFLREPIFASN